ncbi:unnamed protein product [Symbiodinium pilosum]|uniref:Sulfotransferase domain-containing protein n=1 Tax=Symbiodinium pilosum TaxID=2952 RepID=A0A812TVK0_SYMPI|nr:unnamed protein product [Symbiodinium pilosum]
MPRCHVSLGLPYDFGDSDFLYSPSCERTEQLYCPPGLPVALQLTLKAASRSATVWAAMLEGLIPGIVAARRTLGVALSSDKGSNIARWVQEWIEHEEMRLGCPADLAMFSISRSLHMLDDARIGLPMALCPTCCLHGYGRLRVIFIRDPFARMSSFFHGYWSHRKGHLLPPGSFTPFETWIHMILSPNASASPLFEASDLDHVRPALDKPLPSNHRQVVFCIEDVEKSVRRVEDALCRGFQHCTPLPSFPAVKRTKRKPQMSTAVAGLIRERFRFDYEALASC